MKDRSRTSGRPPSATYRLQFNREFSFKSALRVVDYLHELGISHGYASPILQAGPQSTHGYDTCAFHQLNSNLGTPAEFESLSTRLHELGMGLLLDMVPNHMGADLFNAWWVDVLEKGPDSPFSRWFDINWEPIDPSLRGRVLLPVLEDHYAAVLEAGKLKVTFSDGWYGVEYYERKFPISPSSGSKLLVELINNGAPKPKAAAALVRLRSWLNLPGTPCGRDSAEATPQLARRREELGALIANSPELHEAIHEQVRRLNGRPGDPRSYDELHRLLQEQHYQLAHWRAGPEAINYRRFFDITDLIALRMELPEVFLATHELVLRLASEGKLDGFRIDHPDGLWDPQQYLERLQESWLAAAKSDRFLAATSNPQATLYVVVEKILTGDEPLPRDWPVAGTTGYDFLNAVNGLFISGANRAAFDAIYHTFTGGSDVFGSIAVRSKKQVLSMSFGSDLIALTHRLKLIAARSRYGQDFTFCQLHSALVETVAAFPVYRTYAAENTERLTSYQENHVRGAIRSAREANPDIDGAVFEFINQLLLLSPPPDLPAADHAIVRQFVMRFQQLSSPAMAKGLEDTAFYNFNRLISLNEVGGDPDIFGTSVAAFHEHNLAKAEHWPRSLLATATHDTKRGEDARARINVLSEMPQQWAAAVLRWTEANREKKSMVQGEPAPHANDEYLLYQTLVGAWVPDAATPAGAKLFSPRIAAYMLKAIREAKARTSWTHPNSGYEEATSRFVERLLTPDPTNPFLTDFTDFQRTTSFFGRLNSLSQALLKMTSPGVPDFYQGTELWDYNLVDPDNRRPVDYDLRRQLLDDIRNRLAEPRNLWHFLDQFLGDDDTGRVKLFLIWRTLQFRLDCRDLFENGGYVPLEVVGPRKEHVVAFGRTWDEQAVVAIAPRLMFDLTGGEERLPLGMEVWGDTFVDLGGLPCSSQYRNVLTQEVHSSADLGATRLPLAKVLSRFPVALVQCS